MWCCPMAYVTSTANQHEVVELRTARADRVHVLPNVNGSDAIGGKGDGQRRATYRHRANSDGLNGVLALGGGSRHLVEMSCAGESPAVDCGHFCGGGADDGDEDDGARVGALQTGR